MRATNPYRRLRPTFWTDPFITGLGMVAQHLYLYLLTSPYSHVCGFYRQPHALMQHEALLTPEQCAIALDTLITSDRVFWDRPREIVFVKRMFPYQADGYPNPSATILESALAQLLNAHGSPLIEEFLAEYGHLTMPFHEDRTMREMYQAKSQTGPRQGMLVPVTPPMLQTRDATTTHGTRLPDDFALTPERRAVAVAEHLPDPDKTFAEFRDYWRAQPGIKGRKTNWDFVWNNWCRRAVEFKGGGFQTSAEKKQAGRVAARKITAALDEQVRHGRKQDSSRQITRRQEDGARPAQGDAGSAGAGPDDAESGGHLGRDS